MEDLPGKCLVQLLLSHDQGVCQLATQLMDCGEVTKSGGHLGKRSLVAISSFIDDLCTFKKEGDRFWIVLLPEQLLQSLLCQEDFED